jgi:citrate synthase
MTIPDTTSKGPNLDDVIALRSSVCRLSAADGRLSYRGYDVRELGERSTYEETAYLLLKGELPLAGELRAFAGELRGMQKLPRIGAKLLRQLPTGGDAMASIRVLVAATAQEHETPLPPTPEAALGQGVRLVAVAPTLVAAWHRRRLGLKPVLPRKSLGFAANFLAMLNGAPPDERAARALDCALILRADNELNPSTFAARVTASTGADVFGGVIAALSALAGPRHGWHARNVMQALEEIGPAERTGEWLADRLLHNVKIPGFGHQVYRGEDPRSELLRTLAESECERAGIGSLFRTARELERMMLQRTGQYPIVDYHLALLYRAVGLPTDLFTAVFAISRMPGWVAHILEQYQDDRLLRPRAEYIGPVDLPYRPLRQRRSSATA